MVKKTMRARRSTTIVTTSTMAARHLASTLQSVLHWVTTERALQSYHIAKKMNLKVDESKVKLTNASGDHMSVEGETQLFL